MCVGIPARVVELEPSGPHTAIVDVDGAQREVNTVMVDDEGLAVGEWVLLHVGFAMSKIDAAEAADTLAFMAGARIGVRRGDRGLHQRPAMTARGQIRKSVRVLPLCHGFLYRIGVGAPVSAANRTGQHTVARQAASPRLHVP